MKIPIEEANFSGLSLIDNGRVFIWNGRIFRAIKLEHTDETRTLFSSGLVDSLVREGLLIESWISDYEVDGFGLVIEHKMIRHVSYPREWTFSMLKDAGIIVLRANELALKHGYQTKDCNGYNVLFDATRPVYVDICSFIRVKDVSGSLYSYREFLQSYIYPLTLWKKMGAVTGFLSAARAGGKLISPGTYFKMRFPLLRIIDDGWIDEAWNALKSLKLLDFFDPGKFNKSNSKLRKAGLSLASRIRVIKHPAKIETLLKRISRIHKGEETTKWSGYHDEFMHGYGRPLTPRFERIIEEISKLDGIDSILELAGNQGVLSAAVKTRIPSASITCTDADSSATEKGYVAAKALGLVIDWAVLNPFLPETSPLEVPPQDRLKSDLVLALALTHQLILTQPFRLDYVLKTIKSYSRKYVFIEFMPLGIYNGTRPPEYPDWYDEDFFRASFISEFEFIASIQLEENRILYIGKTQNAG